MTHRSYLAAIFATTVVSWASGAIVLYRMDPFTSTALAVPFLFGALFLGITTTFALFGFYSRVWLLHGEIFYHHITVSLRQGALLALALSSMLLLQIFRVLTWWDAVLIIIAILLIESYFFSTDY